MQHLQKLAPLRQLLPHFLTLDRNWLAQFAVATEQELVQSNRYFG